MNDSELIVAVLIGLVVLALVVKFWRFMLGVALIGAAAVAVLCVSGEIDCPFDAGGGGSAEAGPPVLETRYESVPAMDGRLVSTDPTTGYQQWESVPIQKVTGTVVNVGTGMAHDTRLRIVFCSAAGLMLYTGEAAVGTLSPGQSETFEHTGPRHPQLQRTKVTAYSNEVGASPAFCP